MQGLDGGTVNAAARTFRTTNARMGEKSSVPPRGGINPLNRFRYGSQMVLHVTEVEYSRRVYSAAVYVRQRSLDEIRGVREPSKY
jgi:hypothetical protein